TALSPSPLHDALPIFTGKHAAHRPALGMHFEHNTNRQLTIHAKKRLQDIHHELHGGVIVVEHHHLVHGRLAQLGLGFLHHQVMRSEEHTSELQSRENL